MNVLKNIQRKKDNSRCYKIGCCGWSFLNTKRYFGDRWKKRFDSVLQCYASMFDIVEVNSSFYHIPKLETAEKWREQVNKINNKFEFTLKASRIITHTDRFSSEKSIRIFDIYRKVAKRLDSKIILLQCPASWTPSETNIRNFKGFLKKVRYELIAWEPRGKWWDKLDLVKEICSEFNLIHCVDPLRIHPQYFSRKNIAYFRLHGFGKPSMYNYSFNREELYKIKKILISLKKKRNYVFFNNATMYEDALKFIRGIKKND